MSVRCEASYALTAAVWTIPKYLIILFRNICVREDFELAYTVILFFLVMYVKPTPF